MNQCCRQIAHSYSKRPAYLSNLRISVDRKSKTQLLMSSSDSDNQYYRGMDAYQILECPRSADKKQIKAAYRKLVAKWHPDKFPDNEALKKEGGLRMEKINRAYFCLEDDGEWCMTYSLKSKNYAIFVQIVASVTINSVNRVWAHLRRLRSN